MAEELVPVLVGHEVAHVIPSGWRHVTNGKLLSLAEQHGFEVLLSKDSSMPYQQNMSGRRIALLIVRPARQSVPALLALAPKILEALEQVTPGSVTTVS